MSDLALPALPRRTALGYCAGGHGRRPVHHAVLRPLRQQGAGLSGRPPARGRAGRDRRADPGEIRNRLGFLKNVGLQYLTLSRSAGTLSGGEAQRIRLATQIGASLMGVLYILDEPSIGLHQRDNDKLLKTLCRLRDLGNTLIVVEHDEDTMRAADYIVDVGWVRACTAARSSPAAPCSRLWTAPEHHRAVPLRQAEDPRACRRAAPGTGACCASSAAARTICRASTWRSRSERSPA